MIETLAFYAFSGVMVLSALMVITARNPVHSVLFLILAFFNSAGIFVLLGAEFIAMLMVIVYVGAVAVMFLFVVMMMDINYEKLRQGFLRYLPLGLLVALLLFTELWMLVQLNVAQLESNKSLISAPAKAFGEATNTEILGSLLYTAYAFPFQLAGMVLLVAMVGAIVLTLREREGVKRQKVAQQVHRSPADCIEMKKDVPVGKGVM